MQRIQLYIDEELDHDLSARAAQTGRSRSELVRIAIREWLGDRMSTKDPIDDLVGAVDIEADDDHDAVIYDQ